MKISYDKITSMKQITLHGQWLIKAPIENIFEIMTDFEKLPEYFPKVAESVQINKRDGSNLEMEATVKSFGKKFKVKMKTQILPGKGFISDNDSYQFGTSGHEELLLSKHPEGTLVDYTYQVSIHKAWLRIVATPLIKWYSMKAWEKAVINELRKKLAKQ
jgi:carbon monoxide dehydrogenase subunit G